jgi:8-oxo-dGTP pyrophosphatase MutT (NUDIX family)
VRPHHAYHSDVDIPSDLLASHLEPAAVESSGANDLRHAAVLIVLYPGSEGTSIPLIERPEDLRHHPGQLALPGGGHDLNDDSLMITAVRETDEEIGISPDSLTVLGRLRPVSVSTSGFLVFPFVAVCPVKPAMTPNVAEVKRIVEMPISALTRPGSIFEKPAPEGSPYDTTYVIRLREGTVWGATARILVQLAGVLRQTRQVT